MADVDTLNSVIRILVQDGAARIDSYLFAESLETVRLIERRSNGYTQTLNYVQHMLREAKHVCRYAEDGRYYRLHAAERCSDECGQHRTREPELVRALCPHCFVTVTTTGACSLGCE